MRKRVVRRPSSSKNSGPWARMARGQAPLLAFGAMLFASLTARCAQQDPGNEGDAGESGERSAGGSGGAIAGASGKAGGEAGTGATHTGGQSGGGSSGSGGVGGDFVIGTGGGAGKSGPSVPCSPERVSVDCALPPSVCTDANTLTYYTDATCSDGYCVWQTMHMNCPCNGNACLPSTGTASPAPPMPPAQACGSARFAPIAGAAGVSGSTGTSGDGGTAGEGGAAGAEPDDECELPASVCVDSSTLVYYTDPYCSAGWCQFTANTTFCSGTCSNGACQNNITAR